MFYVCENALRIYHKLGSFQQKILYFKKIDF